MKSWDLGSKEPLFIRRERFIGSYDPAFAYRILYASDLHFWGKVSYRVAEQVLEAARQTKPDVILLGGDLVDIPGGISPLSWFVQKSSRLAPLWAVEGNHDRILPQTALKSAVESSGGRWLEGTSFSVPRPNGLQIK